MTGGSGRWVRCALVVLAAAVLGSMAQSGASPEDVDWDEVKRTWHSLSAEQRAEYDRLSIERARTLAQRRGAPPKTPGDDCGAAEFEITDLPFVDVNTTIGQFDFLALSAFGACVGGGVQYAATGLGPDLIYKIETDIPCDLSVQMSPVREDLSLYVMVEDCQFPASNCVRVSDGGGKGDPELVLFSTEVETSYFIWVDGFAGSSDDFTLEVTETSATGCTLVPVELQSFTVE